MSFAASRASRHHTPSDVDTLTIPAGVGSGAVLLIALVFGGATRQGFWSDALVQLAALPLLAHALWRLPQARLGRGGAGALVIAGCVVLLPLLQLIPLPPDVWTRIPGRDAIAAPFTEAGMALPWLGISLSPEATLRSVFALIPPLAVFISVLLIGRRARRALVLTIIAFGFIGVVLGLAQIAQGTESALRFYSITNNDTAVGFFANRNHFAALLYCVLPFTVALAVGITIDRRPEMAVGLILCLLVLAALILGLGMARSRAGLGLAIVAGFGGLAMSVSGRSADGGLGKRRFIFAGAFVGVILLLQFASAGIMQRLEADVSDDARWEINSTTFQAARDFLPFGTGFGTFQPVYRMYESVDQLYTTYVNRAHDDYLETVLEGGVATILILIAFLGWFAASAWRVWRAPVARGHSALDRGLPRAASIAVLTLLLHSAVDYPLRTTAMSTFFAFACAMMIAPAHRREADA